MEQATDKQEDVFYGGGYVKRAAESEEGLTGEERFEAFQNHPVIKNPWTFKERMSDKAFRNVVETARSIEKKTFKRRLREFINRLLKD